MKEQEFELFLNSSINNFIDSYIDSSDYPDVPHRFSLKFRRYVKRLSKKEKHSRPFFVKTGFRRTVTIIVTVIVMTFGAVMSVGAWRKAFFMFITRPFSTHTEVETVSDSSAPTIIMEVYEAEYIPDGFALTESYDIKDCCNTRVYSDGSENIEYTQWVKQMYETSVNTEGYPMEEIQINGFDGFAVNMTRTGRYLVSWDNGDYIFQIVGTIDKAAAIKMAQSIKKQ